MLFRASSFRAIARRSSNSREIRCDMICTLWIPLHGTQDGAAQKYASVSIVFSSSGVAHTIARTLACCGGCSTSALSWYVSSRE